jgi:hypothetical protein
VPDACDGSLDGRRVAPIDDDARAQRGEELRDREPDAAGAAHDDGTAAG